MDDVALIWVLTVLLFFVVAFPHWQLLWRWKHTDPFGAVYLASAYFLLIFPLRSLYALAQGTEFLGKPPFDEATRTAWVVALVYLIVGFGVFYLGYYSPLGRMVARAAPGLPSMWRWRRVGWMAVGLTLIGLMSFILLVKYLGGLETYLTQKQVALTAGGTTYLYQLIGSFWIASAICYLRYTQTRARRHLLQTLVLLVTTLLVGATTGAKGYVFFPLLTILVLRHYLIRRINVLFIVLIGLILTALIPAFNIFRHTQDLSTIPTRYMIVISTPRILLHHLLARFHPLDAVVTIIRDTGSLFPFQYGSTIIPIFVAWIPRAIYPDKPVISYAKVFGETYWAEWFAGTGSAPSVSILGEAYVNFHFPGLVTIAFIAGVLLRGFYDYLVRLRRSHSGLLLYALNMPYIAMFWESDIVGLITRAIFWNLLGILVCLIVARPAWRTENPSRGFATG